MRWIGMSDDGETITQRRFDGRFRLAPAPADPARIRRGAVVDVETTGLDRDTDVVIEIGLRPFAFDKETGAVVQISEAYDGLEDPGRPIPPFVTQLTGLGDDDVRGKQIDWQRVRELIEGVDIVIAHNAAFDRAFIDPRIGGPRKIWGCSHELVDWAGHGYTTSKLEILNLFHGFFVNSHRAMGDVDALLHLLTFHPEGGDRPYLAELIDRARVPLCRLFAVRAPFELNAELKQRGYRWHRERRTWVLECTPSELPAEEAWLVGETRDSGGSAEVERISPFDRYRPGV
jgi:DNA polymerase III subunit epsilon